MTGPPPVILQKQSSQAPYFAYGSNLHEGDWNRWCGERGIEARLLVPLENAWLPDWDCAFRLESVSRGGGVLDVLPRLGQATPGVLFDAGFSAWRALDRKEGCPRVYGRREVSVICTDGRERKAQIYIVQDGCRTPTPIPPAPGYAELVREGLEHHGLPTDLLKAAAAGLNPGISVPRVFVYGTLLRGQCRAAHMDIGGAGHSIEQARVRGQLEDLGAFPGLRLGGPPAARVVGELHRCEHVSALLSVLDGVEGFGGYDSGQGLYRRTLVAAVRDDGSEVIAWTYRLGDEVPRAPIIAGGDWLDHLDT